MNAIKTMTAVLLFVTFSSPAWGFFSVMDTGELLNRGYHRITAEGQIILPEPNDGFNFNGRFATGLNQDSDLQAEFGFGSVDFYVGGFWKWMPFPDTTQQPAFGAKFGITYAKINDVTTYGLNVTPMVSKHFKSKKVGRFTPYVALPMGLQNTSDDTNVTLQGVVGIEYQNPKWRHLYFLLEYGVEIDDAFDHVSFGVALDL